MAYEGYRIKINNNVFNNSDIARGTFSASRSPRLCESYTDAVGVTHETFYPTKKAVINFSIRAHSITEHSGLASFFVERNNIPVQYYDDNTGDYVTGNFKINDFTWAHSNAGSGFLDYEQTAVTMEEY